MKRKLIVRTEIIDSGPATCGRCHHYFPPLDFGEPPHCRLFAYRLQEKNRLPECLAAEAAAKKENGK